MDLLSGGEMVARALEDEGVDFIFGYPGGTVLHIYDALFKDCKVPHVLVRHEQAATHAADGYARATGKTGVVLVTSGPGATNAITGLLVAHDNAWPVLVLGGRRSSFQKFDAVPMVSHVTKHVVNVPSTGSIGECIHEACRIAVSGRPGPVYVDLHEDVLAGHAVAAPVSSASAAILGRPAPSVSGVDIERMAAALLSAARPALFLGKGVRWTVAPAQLQELLETLGLPFITSPMGRGFVPDDHPLCFNGARTVLQSRADVVLILGARLNWMFRHGGELSRDARVFRVDIHRDDEDDVAIQADLIHADAGDFVTRLLNKVKSRHDDVSDSSRWQRINDWHRTLHTVSEETRRLLERQMNDDGQPMLPYRMMKEVRDALPRDGICITEGNVSMIAAQPVIPAFRPASRMDAGTNACLGVGIPFAVGAKVACPDRPVVAVTGDYGFSLCAMEMEVCVRHGIPIVVVVANNQGNNGALKQKAFFPGDDSELVTMFQPGLEYDRIMKMFGGQGTTITDPDLLRPTLEKAISSGTPSCINVVIDPEMPRPNAWGQQRAVQRSEG